MPHLRVLVNKDSKPAVRWYKANKDKLRDILSAATEYDMADIAVIGELLDPDLSDNILDIEFVAELGKGGAGKTIEINNAFNILMMERHKLPDGISAGTWIKSNSDTYFKELDSEAD